jgi:hypothetical protein
MELKQLRMLNLAAAKVTDAGVIELDRELPDCEIDQYYLNRDRAHCRQADRNQAAAGPDSGALSVDASKAIRKDGWGEL